MQISKEHLFHLFSPTILVYLIFYRVLKQIMWPHTLPGCSQGSINERGMGWRDTTAAEMTPTRTLTAVALRVCDCNLSFTVGVRTLTDEVGINYRSADSNIVCLLWEAVWAIVPNSLLQTEPPSHTCTVKHSYIHSYIHSYLQCTWSLTNTFHCLTNTVCWTQCGNTALRLEELTTGEWKGRDRYIHIYAYTCVYIYVVFLEPTVFVSPGLPATDPHSEPSPPRSTSRGAELNTFDLGRATGAPPQSPSGGLAPTSITLEVSGFVPVLQCSKALAVWQLGLIVSFRLLLVLRTSQLHDLSPDKQESDGTASCSWFDGEVCGNRHEDSGHTVVGLLASEVTGQWDSAVAPSQRIHILYWTENTLKICIA